MPPEDSDMAQQAWACTWPRPTTCSAHPADEPTIGLMLCKGKNDVVAEWALRGYSSPIGVSDWTTAITTDLPDDLASSLPSIEEIEAELSDPSSTDSNADTGHATTD